MPRGIAPKMVQLGRKASQKEGWEEMDRVYSPWRGRCARCAPRARLKKVQHGHRRLASLCPGPRAARVAAPAKSLAVHVRHTPIVATRRDSCGLAFEGNAH